jgi:hypothetical protein
MGSDSIKPEDDLEPFYTAIFLPREEWIRGPKAPTKSKGLAGLRTTLGQRRGFEVGTYGPKTRLYGSVDNRDVKEGYGKWQLSPKVALLWKIGGGLTCRRL